LAKWDAANQATADLERASGRIQVRMHSPRLWQVAIWIVVVFLYVAVSRWFFLPGLVFITWCAFQDLRRRGRQSVGEATPNQESVDEPA
jgi:hypothetical protein